MNWPEVDDEEIISPNSEWIRKFIITGRFDSDNAEEEESKTVREGFGGTVYAGAENGTILKMIKTKKTSWKKKPLILS